MQRRVIVTTAIFICVGALLFLKYNVNHRKIDANKCLKNIEIILPGEWQSLDSDYSAILTLKLNSNGTFIYETQHKTEDLRYELTGNWEFIETTNAIKLRFHELNEPWENILSDDLLTQKYPGVIEHNLEKKEITFKVSYLDEEGKFDCKINRYGIDIFNVYLYKK